MFESRAGPAAAHWGAGGRWFESSRPKIKSQNQSAAIDYNAKNSVWHSSCQPRIEFCTAFDSDVRTGRDFVSNEPGCDANLFERDNDEALGWDA